MTSSTSTPPAKEYYAPDESQTQKLWSKTKENPMVPLGFAGMVGMVAYGAYNYKNRGKMSTSIYLMHLRVRAQSMVVGAMALGISYTLLRDYVFNKKDYSSDS